MRTRVKASIHKPSRTQCAGYVHYDLIVTFEVGVYSANVGTISRRSLLVHAVIGARYSRLLPELEREE